MQFQESNTIFDPQILNAESPRCYIPVDGICRYAKYAFLIKPIRYTSNTVVKVLDTNQERDKDNDYRETEWANITIDSHQQILVAITSEIKGACLEYVSGDVDLIVVPLGIDSNTIPAENFYIGYDIC